MELYQFIWPAGEYYFEQPWTLEDVTYQCTLRYNLRVQTWFLDLADVTGAPIVAGVALIPGRNLLTQYRTRGVPPGTLYVYDPKGDGATPSQDDFSLGYLLLYASAA